jgi:nucleotide-binding universal stress UspA family protein
MVPVFHTILSPVNFDENSLAALDYAAFFAQQPGARLYLLHVVQTDAAHLQEELQHTTTNEWLADRIATDRLDTIAQERFGDRIAYNVLVRDGEPAPVILDTAIEVEAQLIVMATHGRAGLSHFFLGSVAERVVREASCPVLTVRGQPTGVGMSAQTKLPGSEA